MGVVTAALLQELTSRDRRDANPDDVRAGQGIPVHSVGRQPYRS